MVTNDPVKEGSFAGFFIPQLRRSPIMGEPAKRDFFLSIGEYYAVFAHPSLIPLISFCRKTGPDTFADCREQISTA